MYACIASGNDFHLGDLWHSNNSYSTIPSRMINNFHRNIYTLLVFWPIWCLKIKCTYNLTLKPHVIHILSLRGFNLHQLDQGLHHVGNWHQQFSPIRLESLHTNGSDKIKRLPSNMLGFKSQEASQYQIFIANCKNCAIIPIKQFIVLRKINNFWSLAEWSR